ncbi:MAG: FtsX-like permease family protein [Sellimonas intestinalis]
MYGQLKALGATSKQLKKIVRKQVNLVAAVGIILGLLFGTAFAVITVPKFLEALMNSQNGKFEFELRFLR